MSVNLDITAIETDRALADILGNFSEDYIRDLINQAFIWKFRPFENRMPNYAYLIEQKYIAIRNNYTGPNPEEIEMDRISTYKLIIDIICENYHLVISNEIPPEQIYELCYVMCQVLLTDFTDKLIDLFSNYISSHIEDLLTVIPDERKNNKSSFSKKVETNPNHILIYENMTTVADAVASLDIPFDMLLNMILDNNTANFILSYIADAGDVYKYYFASFILDPSTRSQMITSIKFKFVQINYPNANILNANTENIFI